MLQLSALTAEIVPDQSRVCVYLNSRNGCNGVDCLAYEVLHTNAIENISWVW